MPRRHRLLLQGAMNPNRRTKLSDSGQPPGADHFVCVIVSHRLLDLQDAAHRCARMSSGLLRFGIQRRTRASATLENLLADE